MSRASTLAKVFQVEVSNPPLFLRIDRLARSTRDLLNTLDAIAKAGAEFKSLSDPWADTTTPHGQLMITILGGLATFERHLIAARVQDGYKRAVAAGVKTGRKSKLTPFQMREIADRRASGETLTQSRQILPDHACDDPQLTEASRTDHRRLKRLRQIRQGATDLTGQSRTSRETG
jgi:hypothetical protein